MSPVKEDRVENHFLVHGAGGFCNGKIPFLLKLSWRQMPNRRFNEVHKISRFKLFSLRVSEICLQLA